MVLYFRPSPSFFVFFFCSAENRQRQRTFSPFRFSFLFFLFPQCAGKDFFSLPMWNSLFSFSPAPLHYKENRLTVLNSAKTPSFSPFPFPFRKRRRKLFFFLFHRPLAILKGAGWSLPFVSPPPLFEIGLLRRRVPPARRDVFFPSASFPLFIIEER